MRSSGILRSWNEERGFGFIAPMQGGAELFVHISAFPRDGSRPVVGETLTFELGRGKDGRPRAVGVVRTAVGSPAAPSRRPPTAVPQARPQPRARTGSNLPSWLVRGATLALLLVVGRWGLQAYQERTHRLELQSQPAVTVAPDSTPAATSFRCDGRTKCSQMTSCAEATWFINHCPGTQMDGNGDGVPCEQQWCTAGGR